MGCLLPVIFLIGGAIVGGPLGAIVGLLLAIAISLGAAKNGTPLFTPRSIIAGGAILGIALVVMTIVAVVHGIHDITHPQEVAARLAAEQKQSQEVATNQARLKQEEDRKLAVEKRHDRLMHECMGDGAIDLPVNAFMEFRKLCEREVTLKEIAPIHIPEIEEQRRIDAQAAESARPAPESPPGPPRVKTDNAENTIGPADWKALRINLDRRADMRYRSATLCVVSGAPRRQFPRTQGS